MLNRFLMFVDRLNERIGNVVSLLMLPMIFLMSFEVFMRYAMDAPTMWGTELVAYLFAGYCLLGGAYTLRYEDHVNINVFYSRQSPRRKAILDSITAVIFFLYISVLLWEGSKFALNGLLHDRHSGTDWNAPLYPILMTLPIGAFLMLIQGVAKFVRDIDTAVGGQKVAK